MPRRRFRFRTMIVGFAVLCVAVLFVFTIVSMKSGSMPDDSFVRAKSAAKNLQQISLIEKSIGEIESAFAAYMLTADQRYLEKIDTANTTVRAGFDELNSAYSNQLETKDLATQAESSLNRWKTDIVDQAVMLRKGLGSESSVLSNGASGADFFESKDLAQCKKSFRELRSAEKETLENALKAAGVSGNGTGTYVVPAVVGAGLGILVLGFMLARHIVRPIRESVSFAEALSLGDLSGKMTYSGKDEAAKLADALNGLAINLGKHYSKLSEGVQVLAGSGAEIAAAASQLSNSATQTSVAISETTAVVREMEKTAKVVNENAGGVADGSRRTDRIASSGSQATEDTIRKMDLIKEKMETVAGAVVALSENAAYVEEIVATVQDLAEQSNLLAVNASIEAARAGDQGRGFAVVAHEIKSLADQSHDATQRVSNILQEIRNSVASVVMATEEGGKAVQEGVEQSQTAGMSIRELAESIVDFSRAAGVIFSSSEQQFSRVERVSGAMAQAETVMRHAVEGTAQLQTEAKRLEKVGHILSEIVAQFKA